MSKSLGIVTFISGALIGGTATYVWLKNKYEALSEAEIESVKESYARYYNKTENKDQEKKDTAVLSDKKIEQKSSIEDYVKRIQMHEYAEYSTKPDIKQKTSQVDNDLPTMVSSNKDIYVISPDEFGEIEEYSKISLTYYENNDILADEQGVVIDNVEDVIGDGLEHFGEFEDDSVYIRNDARHSDYEILKDSDDFNDFVKSISSR